MKRSRKVLPTVGRVLQKIRRESSETNLIYPSRISLHLESLEARLPRYDFVLFKTKTRITMSSPCVVVAIFSRQGRNVEERRSILLRFTKQKRESVL